MSVDRSSRTHGPNPGAPPASLTLCLAWLPPDLLDQLNGLRLWALPESAGNRAGNHAGAPQNTGRMFPGVMPQEHCAQCSIRQLGPWSQAATAGSLTVGLPLV